MSDAERAYAEDVRRRPLYHDGTPRRTWQQLSAIARASWVKNPTPRDWGVVVADEMSDAERDWGGAGRVIDGWVGV